MAVLNFPKVANNSVPMIDLSTGEAVSASHAAYAEYVVKETVDVGSASGGRRSSISQFGICAASQEACDVAGGQIAQLISDASFGGPVSLYKKLGTFLQGSGQGNVPIARGATKYAVITWTNGLLDGETGTEPVENVQGQIYLPFVDVDRLNSALPGITSAITGGQLARARVNQAGDGFEVGISRARLGVKLNDYNSIKGKVLTREDTTAGITDGVLEDRLIANP